MFLINKLFEGVANEETKEFKYRAIACFSNVYDSYGSYHSPLRYCAVYCELPSRVTLVDFQTTKKLANPHKY